MPLKDPDERREYQKNWRRLRRSGDLSTPRQTRLTQDFRVRTAADVLLLLDEAVAEVRAEEDLSVMDRARVIGFLSGVILKAVEAGNMLARLEALEAALKQRSNSR